MNKAAHPSASIFFLFSMICKKLQSIVTLPLQVQLRLKADLSTSMAPQPLAYSWIGPVSTPSWRPPTREAVPLTALIFFHWRSSSALSLVSLKRLVFRPSDILMPYWNAALRGKKGSWGKTTETLVCIAVARCSQRDGEQKSYLKMSQPDDTLQPGVS